MSPSIHIPKFKEIIHSFLKISK